MSSVNNGPKAAQTFKNKHIKGAMKRGTSAIESVFVLLALTYVPVATAGEGQSPPVTVNKPSTTKVPDERNWVSVSSTGNNAFSLLIITIGDCLCRIGLLNFADELSDVHSNFYV